MSERKYRPGERPEDILFIHVWNRWDPEDSSDEEEQYPWAVRVVVRGHTRESYHVEQYDAIVWAQETSVKLLIKTAPKES